MGIITSPSNDFNTQSSQFAKNLSEPPRTHAHTRGQALAIADKLCSDNGYKRGSVEKIVRTLIKLSNLCGQVFDSRKRIAFESGYSEDTVKRVLNLLVVGGHIIDSRRGTWRDRQTNVISLLFLNTELPDVDRKMRVDLRSNNNNLNTNYESEVSKPRKYKKKDPDKPKSPPRFVNPEALKQNFDHEVTRICNAWSLTAKQTEYALKRAKAPGITNPPQFIATMAKALSLGAWNDTDLPPEKPKQLNHDEIAKIEIKAEQLAKDRLTELGIDLVHAQATGDWVQCKMQFVSKLEAEARQKLRESIN